MSIYHAEDEKEQLMTKVSVLRIITQLGRLKKDTLAEQGLDQPTVVMANNPNLIHTLNTVVSSSTDHILVSLSLFILHQLLKSVLRSGGSRDASVLQLDTNRIYQLFDQNVSQGNKLISVISCGLMAEILSLEGQSSQFIFQKFTGTTDALGKVNILIDINSPAETTEMKLLQGTNFGCPYAGFYDQPFNLLNKIQQKQIYETRGNRGRGDILSLPAGAGLADTIMAFILNLNSKTDLSPKGFVSLLSFIHDAIANESKAFMQKIFKNCLKLLCSTIRDNQLLSIQEWPNSSGGGVPAACMVTTHVLRLFNIPFNQQIYEKESETISVDMARADIVHLTLNSLRYLTKENIPIAVSLISKLVFTADKSKDFAQQFVQGGGLATVNKYELLDRSTNDNTSLIIDTLSLISQLARISKEFYDPIHNANIYADLKNLIAHEDAGIRAKVCNLIGNLCRHTGFFYEKLLKHSLIAAAIECCRDPDRNTRKFACFAVGNAGFHNEVLYEHLRPCVQLLVELLKDQEEKTRANAAGALGNFVRNSNALCKDLIKHHALKQLLDVVANDKGPSQSPRRIALFSIGNLCVYKECRKALEDMGIR